MDSRKQRLTKDTKLKLLVWTDMENKYRIFGFKRQNWYGKQKAMQCKFFYCFRACSNFLEHFWCDFCYDDIFIEFSIMFWVYVNFSELFGIVWIFLWILELIICFQFSAQFGDRKNSKRIYSCPLWLCRIYCIFIFEFRGFIFCFNSIFKIGLV